MTPYPPPRSARSSCSLKFANARAFLLVQRAANRASESIGAVMRCAPIGLQARDAADAAAAARDDAALSHPHPVCRAASAAFTAAIATAIGGGDRDAMLDAAEAAMSEPEAEPVRARLALARASERPAEFMHQMGWVLTAFQSAFNHLASGTALEDAIIQTAGEGQDTDTNAAICGALLGAAQGRAAAPVRWVMPILACRPMKELRAPRPRPAEFWPTDLPILAEALVRRKFE